MRNLSAYLFIIFSLICLAPHAQGAEKLSPTSDAAKEIKIQQPSSPMAPDFTLKDLSGKTLSLKDYRGKAVLLDFTTTWCPYCRYDIPKLKKLYDANKGKDFELLAIYINENQKRVSSFASQYALPYTVLLDTDASVAKNYGIRGVPTKIVVRKDGTISCWQCADAEGKINEILKGK